jgi:hypothetical protein
MKYFFSALAVVVALAAHPTAQSQTAANIVGDWDITTVSPLGEQTNPMAISKDGDGYKAVVKSPQGELPYDKVQLAGNTVTIVLTIQYENSPMIITYTGRVEEKTMSGDADFGGLAQGTWSAVRK